MTKNLKALLEKRNTLVAEMNGMVGVVEEETRSFDETEVSRLAEIRSEVTSIDATIEQVKEMISAKTWDEWKGITKNDTHNHDGSQTIK